MPISETMVYDAPAGLLQLEARNHALTSIRFQEPGTPVLASTTSLPTQSVLTEAKKQLQEYFEGKRTCFELKLSPEGTAFQQQVWRLLQDIPYGQTTTYGALAQGMGDPRKVRAVGRANGLNPLPIVIPCHRVIGAGNKLIGYAGGIDMKRRLLQLEGALLL